MYTAIVFLPLLGFLIAGLFGRLLGPRPSELITTSFLFIAMVLAWIVFRPSAVRRAHADGAGAWVPGSPPARSRSIGPCASTR